MVQWSEYSKALFDFYVNSTKNFIVQACPGAGKTTNIMELWNLDDHSTCYVVFNRANADEAKMKLPQKSGSDILTLNSLGHKVIMNNYGGVTLEKNKTYKIIDDIITYRGVDNSVKRDMKYALAKMVNTAKSIVVNPYIDPGEYEDMIDVFDLRSYDGMLDHANKVLQVSDDMRSIIDFNDQIRIPALYDLSMPYWYNVLGDESQDFSAIQAMLIAKIHAERYGFVGDRHQSIYAFRGAMNNSLDYLKEQFHCTELPLSITYRCAKDIVREAQQIYSDILPWDESPQGRVVGKSYNMPTENIPYERVYDKDTIIVCRNNRPLIDMAYTLLNEGIPCYVRGRDIGDGLISLIKKLESEDVRSLITDLEAWYGTEMQKAMIKEDEDKIRRIEDRYGSIQIFISKCALHDNVQCVIDAINAMFEQGRGVCLSTVHKAKGLEAERCYLLCHELFDTSIARQRHEYQRIQERNIKYVAITRARKELVYM